MQKAVEKQTRFQVEPKLELIHPSALELYFRQNKEIRVSMPAIKTLVAYLNGMVSGEIDAIMNKATSYAIHTGRKTIKKRDIKVALLD